MVSPTSYQARSEGKTIANLCILCPFWIQTSIHAEAKRVRPWLAKKQYCYLSEGVAHNHKIASDHVAYWDFSQVIPYNLSVPEYTYIYIYIYMPIHMPGAIHTCAHTILIPCVPLLPHKAGSNSQIRPGFRYILLRYMYIYLSRFLEVLGGHLWVDCLQPHKITVYPNFNVAARWYPLIFQWQTPKISRLRKWYQGPGARGWLNEKGPNINGHSRNSQIWRCLPNI